MSAALVSAASLRKFNAEAGRRGANFNPSVWGDFFLTHAPQNTEEYLGDEKEREKLKEEVRSMIEGAPTKSVEKLNLIDVIQRLGVAYHFEREIEISFTEMYDCYEDWNVEDRNDLFALSLRFRLLREQGFPASSDVFEQFKDPNGKFKESLVTDVEGILNLYEATHFRVHGEEILDEALDFTRNSLKSMLPVLTRFHAMKVNQALDFPIQQSVSRLAARQYLSIYQEDESRNEKLLHFAKLDFNAVQKVHKEELNRLTRWWKDLDYVNKYPFARDRMVEVYLWPLAISFEPRFSCTREFLAKFLYMASLIDDIYDTYGSFEELQLLTEAFQRWDINTVDQLPLYLRPLYRDMLKIYEDTERMVKGMRQDFMGYAIDKTKELFQSYFEQSKWFHHNRIPTMEEYMKVGRMSSSYQMQATSSFIDMGALADKKAFEWVTSESLISTACETIGRLLNDLVGHEEEQERGHESSSIECYMNEYGVSKKEARKEIEILVEKAWKDLNQGWLQSITEVPMPLLKPFINLARVSAMFYRSEDGYTVAKTFVKEFITLMLVDPIEV